MLRSFSRALGLGLASLALAAGVSAQTLTINVTDVPAIPVAVVHDFGYVLAGSTPQTTFTFTNKETHSITWGAVAVAGAARLVTHTCVGALAIGDSCSLTLGMAAVTAIPNVGTVSVARSDTMAPNTYTLKANGVNAGTVFVTTSSTVSFLLQPLNTTSTLKSMALTNSGAQAINLAEVAIAENATMFAIDSTTCTGILASGSSCTVQLSYTPLFLGEAQSRLKVTLDNGLQVFVGKLAGSAVQGMPEWQVGSASFIDVAWGVTAPAQAITLKNTGAGPLTISALTLNGDAAFSIVNSTCPSVLATLRTCVVSVTVKPQDGLVRTSQLTLQATGTSATLTRVPLYARPLQAVPLLLVDPLFLDFGVQKLGAPASLSLVLKSIGTAPMVVSAYALSGTNAADFNIQNPTACVGTLAPGKSCSIQVSATPGSVGVRTASLAIASPLFVPAVPLTVRGAQGALTLAQTPLDFGTLAAGTSKILTTLLTNTGATAVVVGTWSLTGPDIVAYKVQGCTGITLAPLSTCLVSVTYGPTGVGAQGATATLGNDGVNPALALGLQGGGAAPILPSANLAAFVCTSPVRIGTVATCAATLRNTGAVPLTVSGATRTGSQFTAPVSTCGSVLAIGASCVVTVTVSASQSLIATTTVQMATGAGMQTQLASVEFKAPVLTLTAPLHGTVMIGNAASVIHRLSNPSIFSIPLTLPPVLRNVAGAVFAVSSHNCPATLVAGTSCSIVSKCVPVTAGVFSGTLTVNGEGASARAVLGCTGLAAAPTSAQLRLLPNPLNLGNIPVGLSATGTLMVTNMASSAITLSSVAMEGLQAGQFSVDAKNCLTTLAPSASCAITVKGAPSMTNVIAAPLLISSTATGEQARAQVQMTGTQGDFVATPIPLNFGGIALGSAKSLDLTFTNSGTAPASILSASKVASLDASAFSISNNRCLTVVAPGATCTLTLVFTPAQVRAYSASLSVAHNGTSKLITVPLLGIGQPAPVAAGTLSQPVCNTPVQLGQTVTCTLTLRSTGALPLMVASPTFGMSIVGYSATVSFNCPSSMAPGSSCTVTALLVPQKVGSFSNTVRVLSNAGLLEQPITFSALSPNIQWTVIKHARLPVGATDLKVQVLTNKGLAAVSAPVISVGPLPLSASSSTCSAGLAPGASCTVTTQCVRTSAKVMQGTISATVNGAASISFLSCEGVAPAVSVENGGPLNTTVGGWSRSGNWFRIVNKGAGPVSINALYPAGPDWLLFADPANANHCAPGRVIPEGGTCLVLETLVTGAPSSSYRGTQRIDTTAGDVTWISGMATQGVLLEAVTAFGDVQANDIRTVSYRLTNQAPYPLTTKTVTSSSSLFRVETPTSCASLAAGGQAGSSCLVKVSFTGQAGAVTSTSTLQVLGGYPQVINAQAFSVVQQGVQGSIRLSVTSVPVKVVLTMGLLPQTTVGAKSTATHTVSNQGMGSVALGLPVVSGTGHLLISTTCGAILAPGASCLVTSSYAPTTSVAYNGTLHFALPGGALDGVIAANVLAATDVAVTVDDGQVAVLSGGTSTFLVKVSNQARAAKVTVALSDSGGSGLVAARGAITCSAPTGTCGVVGATSVVLSLPAYGVATLSVPRTYAQTTGTYGLVAALTIDGATDSNPANNSATNTTDIVKPQAELSVTAGALSTQDVSIAGYSDIVVRNNSTGALASSPVQARFDYAATSVSNGASLSLGAPICLNGTLGTYCTGTTLTLPAGAMITIRVPFTTGAAAGQVRLETAITLLTTSAVDPVASNNFTRMDTALAPVPREKLCMFSVATQGKFLGCGSFSTGAKTCDNGAGYTSNRWMDAALFDGWTTQNTGYFNSPVQVLGANKTWKGTSMPVTQVIRGSTGFNVLPQVQRWNGATWMGVYQNYVNGQQVGATLAYWTGAGSNPGQYYQPTGKAVGTTTIIGAGASGIWSFLSNGTPIVNYKSSGVGADGATYRQTWVENSPGPTCKAPGTQLAN
ncbi:MAG: choice-of-anchor D domain-containing protein [Agitococcus sp.]|nr:choice-of-anchor D domain-containing protein [Agitococcus sp.]